MTTFLEPGAALLDIPELPDRGRMYREIGDRLRAAMKDKAAALHLEAHETCFVANSVNFPVRHEPVVQAASAPER